MVHQSKVGDKEEVQCLNLWSFSTVFVLITLYTDKMDREIELSL